MFLVSCFYGHWVFVAPASTQNAVGRFPVSAAILRCIFIIQWIQCPE
jgi:hypothetical protein